MNWETPRGASNDWFDEEFSEIVFGGMSTANKAKKPPSLPDGWPKPDSAGLKERPRRLIAVGTVQNFSFKSNFVTTSKYTLYNFIPLFLLEVRRKRWR